MMAKLPWFRFEATAWLTDPQVRLMTSQQRGWYIDMLCWCWQEGGMYADAMRTLCICRTDIEECDNFGIQKEDFDSVLSHFSYDCGDGRVSHPKLEENRLDISQRSEKATISANKRWRKTDASSSHCDGNAKALQYKSISISSSESEKEKSVRETKTRLPKGYALDEQYKTFREACSAFGMAVIESDFTGPAWHEWCALDPEQRQAAIAGIGARAEGGVDPQMVPRPQKYLVNREWKRAVNGAGRAHESLTERMIREAKG